MESIKTDEITYDGLLKVCHYLAPTKDKEKKNSVMKSFFGIGCRDGLLLIKFSIH